ncbi:LacI family DNA-binding transcriptional regulator [Enterocloster aldenensis]|uniref:LacI family DNA-binding transcriptional regulator n=1 Tax=Enterocloster aldenensis TaxID=358742 RepID=UPI00402754DC
MKKAKIADVAETAGVSTSTVSNYLNGRFHTMSGPTKEKIEQAIAKLDYVPSLSARRLSSKGKGQTVCVIVPTLLFNNGLYDNGYGAMIHALSNLAMKKEYHILVYVRTMQDIQKEIDFIRGMSASIIDGFICYDLRESDPYFQCFETEQIPYVCIGKYRHMEDYHYVASDHGKVTKEAVMYLAGLGHRRILLISEGLGNIVYDVRLTAYEEAVKEAGIPFEPDYIMESDYITEEGREADSQKFERLWNSPRRPTAVIVVQSALGIIERAVPKYRIRIPEELSVIVLNYQNNGTLGLKYTNSPTQISDVVGVAFKKLLRNIDNPKQRFKSQLVQLDFVEGETTAAPGHGETDVC